MGKKQMSETVVPALQTADISEVTDICHEDDCLHTKDRTLLQLAHLNLPTFATSGGVDMGCIVRYRMGRKGTLR